MAKADLKKKVVLDIPTTEEEKKKALQSAIAHITKVYGTGAIMRLGENKANLNVEAIPTGSMMLGALIFRSFMMAWQCVLASA